VSALTEAKTRLVGSRDEAAAACRDAERGIAELASAAEIETKLGTVRGEIETHRVHLAEVRAEAQAFAREAELAARRLAQIGSEREGWTTRKDSAASQLATLEQRVEEAKTERASLNDAPAAFAEKRTALISEIETAETARRAAADQLAEAENALAAADKDARTALEAVGAAREDAARAEERFAGANRRVADIEHEIREMLEIEPAAVAEIAEIKPGEELPAVADVESKLDRIRRERERLGAVNLRAEEELREVETQHGNLT
jgi:chromosome segregation protein